MKPLLKIVFKQPQNVWYDGICSLAEFVIVNKTNPTPNYVHYNMVGNVMGAFIKNENIKSIEFIQPN